MNPEQNSEKCRHRPIRTAQPPYTGVCPNCWRNLFDGFFLRLRILPRSMTNVTFIANTINFDSSEVKFAKAHDGALC